MGRSGREPADRLGLLVAAQPLGVSTVVSALLAAQAPGVAPRKTLPILRCRPSRDSTQPSVCARWPGAASTTVVSDPVEPALPSTSDPDGPAQATGKMGRGHGHDPRNPLAKRVQMATASAASATRLARSSETVKSAYGSFLGRSGPGASSKGLPRHHVVSAAGGRGAALGGQVPGRVGVGADDGPNDPRERRFHWGSDMRCDAIVSRTRGDGREPPRLCRVHLQRCGAALSVVGPPSAWWGPPSGGPGSTGVWFTLV